MRGSSGRLSGTIQSSEIVTKSESTKQLVDHGTLTEQMENSDGGRESAFAKDGDVAGEFCAD
jgi:hypothetical protein